MGKWSREECEYLREDGFDFSEADQEEMLRINEQFHPFGMYQGATLRIAANDRLDAFARSGMMLAPWKKDKKLGNRVGGGAACSGLGNGPGWNLLCIDYGRALTEGLESMIAECDAELESNRYFDKRSFERGITLQAMRLSLQGLVNYAARFSKLAAELAAAETRPQRKKELEEISEICACVPAKPARTFREAMQCFWFMFLLINPAPTPAIGRFDQYMYPFYKADIDAGKITDDEVLELLEIMRCKVMKVNRVSGKANRAKNAGMAKWYNWTIGGQKADGSDATNELSYLLLEAAQDTHLPHHTVTVRVHQGTPEKLMLKALECVKSGLGMPAFLGDESYINFFANQSEANRLPLEEARDYCATGCVDGNVPAVTRTQVAVFFIIPHAMDIAMHNGYCRYTKEDFALKVGDVTKMATFEEFKNAVYEEIRYLMAMANERINVEMIAERELFPDVFRSALMKDGVKVGKDMFTRRFDFENGAVLGAVGGVNTGNALYAIKKLVFEEKKYTMAQLLEALDADWEGYEAMRKDFRDQPKYGNAVKEVDDLVAEVYQLHADTCLSLPCVYGDSLKPNAISISAHQPGGALTGATADGRKGGEILADASLSPDHGQDVSGPLAVFRSAMEVDQDPYQGTLMNMKFHPSNMKTEEDLKKLGSLIRTYLTHGGKHIQFNVVDRAEMEDAKVHPEEHPELVVRVAGYSAYFTRLPESIQNEVIDRTSPEL